MGIIIAGFAFVIGFAVIWHIWWLAVIGLVGCMTSVILRLCNDDTEETYSAAYIQKIDQAARNRQGTIS